VSSESRCAVRLARHSRNAALTRRMSSRVEPSGIWAIGPRETSPRKSHRKLSATGYLFHSSVRFLSQAFNGRDRPTDQRLVYGKSTRMLGSFLPFSFSGKWKVEKCKRSVKRGESVKVYSVREELVILSTLSSRVLYRLCLVLYWILLKTHWLNVNWTLLKLYKVFLFIFSSLVFSHYGI